MYQAEFSKYAMFHEDPLKPHENMRSQTWSFFKSIWSCVLFT